jgi:hypothetical protein
MEREAYHGEDYNGEDCRRLICRTVSTSRGWTHQETHDPTQSTVTINEPTANAQYRDSYKKLDVVFSTVRGVDFLLPTQRIQTLKTVIEAVMSGFTVVSTLKVIQRGLILGLTATCLHTIKHGGLADKTEDPIEFDHQEWKREREDKVSEEF